MSDNNENIENIENKVEETIAVPVNPVNEEPAVVKAVEAVEAATENVVDNVADTVEKTVEAVAEPVVDGTQQIVVPVGAIEEKPEPVVEAPVVVDKKAQKAAEKAAAKEAKANAKAEAKAQAKAEKAAAKENAKAEKKAEKEAAKQALIDQCPREYRPVGTSRYFWFLILGGIPVIGLIVSLFLSIIPRNKNFKCFNKAIFAFHLIGIILLLGLLLVLMFVFNDSIDDIMKALESIVTAFQFNLL